MQVDGTCDDDEEEEISQQEDEHSYSSRTSEPAFALQVDGTGDPEEGAGDEVPAQIDQEQPAADGAPLGLEGGEDAEGQPIDEFAGGDAQHLAAEAALMGAGEDVAAPADALGEMPQGHLAEDMAGEPQQEPEHEQAPTEGQSEPEAPEVKEEMMDTAPQAAAEPDIKPEAEGLASPTLGAGGLPPLFG